MNYNSSLGENLVRKVLASVIAVGIVMSLPVLSTTAAQTSAENNTAKTGHKTDPKTIVVLGDSLVAGYGLAPGEAFPEQLEELLSSKGYNIDIVNAGVSGDTTAGGLARLDWSVGEGIDGVIVELGANDALRGLAPEQSQKNLEAIIAKLGERGVTVLLAGMRAPPNMGQNYVEKFDRIYPGLAEKYDLVFYPFFLQGVAAIAELNQHDGIHPTAEGISKITASFLPSAISLIEKLEAKN